MEQGNRHDRGRGRSGIARRQEKSIQGTYWIGTLSAERYPERPTLKEGFQYIKGQLEQGEGGFKHWQVLLVSKTKHRLSRIIKEYPHCHWELCRSKAANEYVWKEETRIEGTQFEEGEVSFD